MNMAQALHTIGDLNNATPTSDQVWSSIRNKDIPKSIRGFLWKSLHEAYKIGKFWDNIPQYEIRGQSSRVIWKAAKDLWLQRETSWPEIRFGTILGCNLITLCNTEGKTKVGATRLFKILVLESAYLIWKLRCERAIRFDGDKDKYHSETEIYNKWIHAINMRLKFDRLLTDSEIWKTSCKNRSDRDNLLDNWIRQAGVLVGMTPRHPPGRTR
ncbi:hypothetical protein EV702DRAFT_1177564 [Suillus placidus]|uniref:Reverse transcriptase zinc-binding domain-containing protein n=1 Tax=Suillus placidus TaxID=48579 RepID=A0A9P7A418_9AGAM|nr:hypothetical protein EV702DRAFT_1177564 [Suillus placidus]